MIGPIATEIHMATVRHERWDPCLLHRTSLRPPWVNLLKHTMTLIRLYRLYKLPVIYLIRQWPDLY